MYSHYFISKREASKIICNNKRGLVSNKKNICGWFLFSTEWKLYYPVEIKNIVHTIRSFCVLYLGFACGRE